MCINIYNVFQIIKAKYTNKITDTTFGRVCVLCGSTNQIEMLHIRSVKDVRGKMLTKSGASYAQWVGGRKRKQIPLCKYHHGLLHSGKLTPANITILRNHK